MNVRRLVPALCAVLALTLAACTTGSSPTPSPTAAIPATATRDVNALTRDRVRDGGLLRFSLTTLPNQWNPRHADAAAEDASRILAPLTPQHFTLDAAGRATANPDFIVSVEVENSPATRVTLHLNPLARWGDGTKITATSSGNSKLPAAAHNKTVTLTGTYVATTGQVTWVCAAGTMPPKFLPASCK